MKDYVRNRGIRNKRSVVGDWRCGETPRLPDVIRHAFDAALLRRNPYLRMVVAPDGVADGAMVVAAVHAILMIPFVIGGAGVLDAATLILSGLVGWILLSGLVYLIGKHALDGYGSFPGTMAATSIGQPVLLIALLLSRLIDPFDAILVVSVWLVLTIWVAARVALELDAGRGAIAAVGGWFAYLVVISLFRI